MSGQQRQDLEELWQERDEARAECERLQQVLTTTEELEAAESEALAACQSENTRLCAALAMFADRDNWECFDVCDDEDGDGEYRGVSNFKPSELPWTIAQEALSPKPATAEVR